jgi:exoribonuclease R
MEDLLESNLGHGYCHAWYTRRFLQSVKVSEAPGSHSGLGLSCYVQWSSPIRRFTDLQVHVCVKRYLRRRRMYELLQAGEDLPSGIDLHRDLGAVLRDRCVYSNGTLTSAEDLDRDLNLLEGIGLVGAARTLQRQSQQYWLFEYVRRQHEADPDKLYAALVLGCVDPERQQYAIYVEGLGLEHRYANPGKGRLETGATLNMKVDSVSPRIGVLTFVQAV